MPTTHLGGSGRVLVLDASLRQSVAACRALGRAGYDVGAAGYNSTEPISGSRFVRRYHRLPNPHGPEQTFMAELNQVIERERYQVIVVSDDATLVRLAPDRLPIPSCPVLGERFHRITDKVELAELCKGAGIPYPTTFAPEDAAEAGRVLSAMEFPVVVKAARSAEPVGNAVREQKGATIADDPTAALQAFSALKTDGLRPIIQKRVTRVQKIVVAIVRRNQHSEMRYAQRLIREYPPPGGIGATLESIEYGRGVGALGIDALERLCDAAGYEGVAQAECIVSGDQAVYLIEVNPRLWASSGLAERLGQRVAERGVRFALGLSPLPQSEYPAGRIFHHIPSEVRWASWHREGRFRALAEVVLTSRPWHLYDLVDFRDPVPLVRQLLGRLR
jgi:predicted ATP-grasp superfamily ATP-dependent carboligase